MNAFGQRPKPEPLLIVSGKANQQSWMHVGVVRRLKAMCGVASDPQARASCAVRDSAGLLTSSCGSPSQTFVTCPCDSVNIPAPFVEMEVQHAALSSSAVVAVQALGAAVHGYRSSGSRLRYIITEAFCCRLSGCHQHIEHQRACIITMHHYFIVAGPVRLMCQCASTICCCGPRCRPLCSSALAPAIQTLCHMRDRADIYAASHRIAARRFYSYIAMAC